MSYLITGLICFFVGATFGVFIMSALSLAKHADEAAQKELEEKFNGT